MGIRLPDDAITPRKIDANVAVTRLRSDVRASRRRARRPGWKRPITDGPFAETKEMLGGASSFETPAAVGTDTQL